MCTAAVIQEILGSADRAGSADDQPARTVSVLSNPECLAEGTTLADLEAIDGQWVPSERILTPPHAPTTTGPAF